MKTLAVGKLSDFGGMKAFENSWTFWNPRKTSENFRKTKEKPKKTLGKPKKTLETLENLVFSLV